MRPWSPAPRSFAEAPERPAQPRKFGSFLTGKRLGIGLALAAPALTMAGTGNDDMAISNQPPAKVLNFGTWNVHGEALSNYQTFVEVMEEHELSGLAVQEVNQDDIRPLKYLLSSAGIHVTYTLADNRQNLLKGGQGNMILTYQKPTRVKSETLDGMSDIEFAKSTMAASVDDIVKSASSVGPAVIGGLITGSPDKPEISLESSKKALQESRAVTSVTIKANLNGELQDIRFINTHMPSGEYPELRDKQYKEMRDFLEKESGDEVPAVVCGDFNQRANTLAPELGDVRFVLADPTNRLSTVVLGHKIIDHCASYSAGKLEWGKITTQGDPHDSDHRMRIMKVRATSE